MSFLPLLVSEAPHHKLLLFTTSSQCEKSTRHDSLKYCLVEGMVRAQQWGPACSEPATGPLQCELMACLDLHFIRHRRRVNVKQAASYLSSLLTSFLLSFLPPSLPLFLISFLPLYFPCLPFFSLYYSIICSSCFLLSFPLACSNIQFSFLSFTCSIVPWMWNSADDAPCLLSQILISSPTWAMEFLPTLSSWNTI